MMTAQAHRKQWLIATVRRPRGGPECAREPGTETDSMLDFPLRRIGRCGARTNRGSWGATPCVGKR